MLRREVLGLIGASGFYTAASGRSRFDPNQSASPTRPNSLRKPAGLQKGDTVGVVALSTPIIDPDDYAKIEPTIASFGLKAKIAPHVHGRSRELGASIRDRVNDLHALFADAQVKAILCARGGYGATEILPYIDYDLVRRNPKIFVGYSETTVLHAAMSQRSGLMTFHGPMPVASSMTSFTQDSFRRTVFAPGFRGVVPRPNESNPLRPAYPLRTIRSGVALGRVAGGNLSMVISLMGTPYEVDTRDRILFLEDVDEEPYRIGRMLIQLHEAGKLDSAAGIIMGKCKNCGPAAYQPSTVSPYTLGEHIDQVMMQLKIPVLSGMAVGHTDDQVTLPIGAMARLDADSKTLEILESTVS